MGSTSGIMLAMLFGALGMGYLVYAKRQQNWIALVAGLGLCAFPYFVSNVWLTLLIGVALASVPFVFREY
jgi:hypothetical protein